MIAKITCGKDQSRFIGEMLLVTIMSILLLGRHIDIFSKVFFQYKDIRLTGWSFAHFIYFFLIGLLCAKQAYTFMLIGFFWELFEFAYGHITNDSLYWTSGGVINQFGDIFMNFIGYSLAQLFIHYVLSDNYIMDYYQNYLMAGVVLLIFFTYIILNK
jgi:hypothetical protein